MAIALQLTLESYSPSTTQPAIVIAIDMASFDAIQTLNIGSQSSGAGAGKVAFHPFSITRTPDAHSAQFWSMLCSGTAFKKVTLMARHSAAAGPFFSFTMGLVAIKTIAFAAEATDGDVKEVITFECGQAAYAGSQQNADGSLGALVASGWNVVKNVQVDPKTIGS